MTLEQAIQSVLIADAAVSALVSTRVYPEMGPQSGTLPSVTYNQATRIQMRNLAGGLVDLNSYSMRLEAHGRTYASAKAVSDAVRDVLLPLFGQIGTTGVYIRGVFEIGGEDDHTPPIHADERGIFHAGLDVEIGYSGGG